MAFQTILDPPILFFCLGVLAVWFKSNIEIPENTSKFLSYYLLLSIGFKGGLSLAKTPFSDEMFYTIAAGVVLAVLIPIWVFYLLKLKLDRVDAAAVAACYGSVSAVTFIAGVSWLEHKGVEFGGHMVALMAIVESPAIILGLYLAKSSNSDDRVNRSENSSAGSKMQIKEILHDAFFNGSVFLLIGSLVIGYFTAPQQREGLQVFVYDIFKGFLSFFLLDLGISAGKQVKQLKNKVWFLVLVSVLAPLINAMLALLLAKAIGLNAANGFLFMIIAASASYIAVPAALKQSLPQAKSSYYLTMSLGLTFPFNILFGLSMYWYLAENYLGI